MCSAAWGPAFVIVFSGIVAAGPGFVLHVPLVLVLWLRARETDRERERDGSKERERERVLACASELVFFFT